MRAHILDENGTILDTVMVDEPWAGMVDADLVGGGPGDSIVDGVLVPGAVAPPVTTPQEHNAPILAALAEIDARSIRPLRAGEMDRLAALEQEAVVLRAQLLPE